MTYALSTNQLSKILNGREVVSNINMTIKKGEIYGLLGPNGAGKTTLMKMFIDLIKPSSGAIQIFGHELKPASFELRKRMGCLIEYPIFYEHLSAQANLEIHCEYMGYYDRSSIDEALELVNLRKLSNQPVKEYSLGMKQRLGIARAFITKPELLILDEPINSLDPKGIKELRDVFKRLSVEYGTTILISSHILGEIEKILDTVGIIKEGRLVEEISMENLRNKSTQYLELNLSDCKKAALILEDELGIQNYKIINDHTLRIYDKEYSQSNISKTLLLNDLEIETINKKHASLEDYFLNVTEGGIIDA